MGSVPGKYQTDILDFASLLGGIPSGVRPIRFVEIADTVDMNGRIPLEVRQNPVAVFQF